MRAKQIAVLLLASLAVSFAASAKENKKMTREEYIKTYAPLAVEQMACFGIPASITLAQGLLESSNGNSPLATATNNHFGIKCGNTWNGEGYRHDDDAPQECFRVYESIRESYIDHSLILLERKWYQPLFELDMKDYKGWAHGLKKAGYATNPKYADLLIEIIEKYELHKYDNALLADYVPQQSAQPQEETKAEVATTTTTSPAEEAPVTENQTATEQPLTPTPEATQPQKEVKKESAAPVTPINVDRYDIAVQRVGQYGIYTQDGRKYIIAKEGDSLAIIASTLGLSERTLRRYNDLDKNYTVSIGDKIFIEK